MTAGRNVLVVGGGVSGYAAAIRLAKTGHTVTLLDRALPGPDRLGESLDWETPRFLDDLDISLDDLLASDHATIKDGAVASHAMMQGRLRIGFHWVYRLLMTLVGRKRQTYHVDRSALTQTLHDRAQELQVALVQATVESVETTGDRIVAVVDKSGVRYPADHFVDSTGRARILAKALGVGVNKIGPAKFAISTRLQHGYDHFGTRIRLDDSRPKPTWIWDINIAQARTDVGAVFVAEDVAAARRQGSSVVELYRSELARHDDLDWALAQLCPDTELDRTRFQDQVSHRLAGPNWVLAGQAAAVIDPILSSGMSFAFRSGLSAANVIEARTSNANRGDVVAKRHDRVLRSYATTVDTLLDELWYKSGLRFVHGFSINVLLLLVCNFNLNHIQSRWFVRTRVGASVLVGFHRLTRRVVPALFRLIEAMPRWSGLGPPVTRVRQLPEETK